MDSLKPSVLDIESGNTVCANFKAVLSLFEYRDPQLNGKECITGL